MSGAPAGRKWLCALVCGLAGFAAAPVEAAGRVVSFRDAGGFVVEGLLFEAPARPAPAVVLVPMLGRGKEDWETLAQQLASANITALAIDLRDRVLPPDSRSLQGWHTAIGAAVSYLTAELGSGGVGVAGASLGANLAALAAAQDPRIGSLALISPSLDYRGVRIEGAMREYGARPALLVASTRDPYAARSVRTLSAEPPGMREVHWSDTSAHGTLLLARDADVGRAVVDWFRRTLAVR